MCTMNTIFFYHNIHNLERLKPTNIIFTILCLKIRVPSNGRNIEGLNPCLGTLWIMIVIREWETTSSEPALIG